ncbi:DUF4843 domain-containing protein [Parapedobacter deserti]|uniref:DUF4843 domain-containing protein n=1 Tax=Parapedobacter deserti TaxID=1912957 RepID=A0ABV7JTK4_9SPHI
MHYKLTIQALYLLVGVTVLCSSCNQAELQTFQHSANVYFDLDTNYLKTIPDSVTYTFAYDMTKAQDTVNLLTRVSGFREGRVRHFRAYIEQDSSTAIAGEHYEPLKDQYPVPADSGNAFLPLVLYNAADLEDQSVSLIIKLQASDDFGVENPRIIRARVVFSARLEQPYWWSMWLGAYSRVKHQLFILVTEQTEMTTEGLDAPRNTYFANLLTRMLNNPFSWVADNPEKGYVLEPLTEGTNPNYHFYHRDNPSRTILLRYSAAAGRHYFIDENGQEVR